MWGHGLTRLSVLSRRCGDNVSPAILPFATPPQTSLRRNHRMSPSTTTLAPPEDAAEPCTLCFYPAWTKEDRPRESQSDYEVSLEDFAAVISSADNGCDGCKFLNQVWQHVIPETTSRQKSSFNFNRSAGDLWIHIFSEERVHNIDTLTLHGMSSTITRKGSCAKPC